MNKFVQVLVWLTLSLSVTAAYGSDKTFSLYVGESTIWEVGSIERVVVGSGSVISTRLLSNGQLIIVADEEGTTNIHLWKKTGEQSQATVYVLPSKSSRSVTELSALLRNIEGVSVKSIAGRPVVEGDIFESDSDILERVLGLYPDVINLTKVSNTFSEKMVYLKMQIVEFSSSDLENLGIDWGTGSIAGPTASLFKAWNVNDQYRPEVASDFTGDLSVASFAEKGSLPFFGIATEIASRINYLVSTGKAFMLASPRLSARSGGEAEFLAGGQVPVVTSSINGTSVEYKDFGIKLAISPVADSQGNITARVGTEISSLDQANAVDGVPGFKTRTAETDINMKDGETLVISGLMNSELNESKDKVKWLGDLPIIGHLFRNKYMSGTKTELVIFVTPTIIDSKHAINHEEISRRDDMLNRFNSSFEEGLFE
ncbi:MAG: pilus assembly protein N-terminal domain-containing protein [Cellvibrionaceae bacterium]